MDNTELWILAIIITIITYMIWHAYANRDEKEKESALEPFKWGAKEIGEVVKEDKTSIIAFMVLSITPLLILGGFVLFIKNILEKLFA
jgi:hypothetical protein